MEYCALMAYEGCALGLLGLVIRRTRCVKCGRCADYSKSGGY